MIVVAYCAFDDNLTPYIYDEFTVASGGKAKLFLGCKNYLDYPHPQT